MQKLEYYLGRYKELTGNVNFSVESDIKYRQLYFRNYENLHKGLDLGSKVLESSDSKEEDLVKLASKFCNLQKNSIFDTTQITERRRGYFKNDNGVVADDIKTELLAVLYICCVGRLLDFIDSKNRNSFNLNADEIFILSNYSANLGQIYEVLRYYVVSSERLKYLLQKPEVISRLELCSRVRDYLSSYLYQLIKAKPELFKHSRQKNIKNNNSFDSKYKHKSRRNLAKEIFASSDFKLINNNPNNSYKYKNYESLIKPLEGVEFEVYEKLQGENFNL